MSTGSFNETFFSISWPTGEFAGMGLEGAVKLGRRAELLAITDLGERKARYERMVADAYAWSKALNAATVFEVDDVIDPADTKVVGDGPRFGTAGSPASGQEALLERYLVVHA